MSKKTTMYHKMPLQPANRKKRRFPRILLWLLIAAGLALALFLYLLIQVLEAPQPPSAGQLKAQGTIPPYSGSGEVQTPSSDESTTTATYLDDEGRSQAAATAPESTEAAPETETTATQASEPATTAPITTVTAPSETTRATLPTTEATTTTTRATAATTQTTQRVIPTTAPRPRSVQAEKPAYTVQFGAFLVLNRAKHLAAQLKKKGIKTRIDEVTDSKGKLWYKVRTGNYPDKREAQKAQRIYNKKSGIKTIIGQATN